MRQRTGITKEYFVAYITYALVAIFGSISISSAVFTVACVFASQIITYPVLGLSRRFVRGKYQEVICMCVCGVTGITSFHFVSSYLSIYEIAFTPLFSNGLLVLLCVFLFVDQHKDTSSYSTKDLVIQNGLFAFVIICMSIIREILGQGTFFRIRIFEKGPFVFLSRSFGGAMLLVLFLLIAVSIYRYIYRKNFSLIHLHEASSTYRREQMDPIVIIKLLPKYILIVLLFFAESLILFFIYYFLLPKNTSLEMILVTCVALHTILLFIFCPILSKIEIDKSMQYCQGGIIILQALFAAIPYNMQVLQERDASKIPLICIGLLFYQILAWLFIGVAFLSTRAFRRKSLFWQIPAVIDGVPFLILIFGIFLVIFSGVKSMGDGILERVIYYLS